MHGMLCQSSSSLRANALASSSDLHHRIFPPYSNECDLRMDVQLKGISRHLPANKEQLELCNVETIACIKTIHDL